MVLSTALIAAIVVGVMAATGGASQGENALGRGQGVGSVLSVVRGNFGDGRLLSASVSGSTLSVRLASPASPEDVKSVFEAFVLGHAVSSWLTAHGLQGVNRVLLLDSRGNVLSGTGAKGEAITKYPAAPALPHTGRESATRGVARSPFVLLAARTLPIGNGVCVFVFQASDPSQVAGAFAGVAGQIVDGIEPHPANPAYPYFLELDDQTGRPQIMRSWVPGNNGMTWIAPSLAGAIEVPGSTG